MSEEKQAEYIFSGINEPTYKELKQRLNDAIEYIHKNKQIESTYKCVVDGITREFNTYKLYCEPTELLEILGDKE